MSTVGSASATESVGGNTTTELGGEHFTVEGDSAGGRDDDDDDDEDMLSMDTDDRNETETGSIGASGYGEAMDEDLDNLATRSVGGFEDRMSDDGNASLVGFGEGAGSTVSGPIYHRRPLPGGGGGGTLGYPQYHSSAAAAAAASGGGSGGSGMWGLERSNSGLSAEGGLRRDAGTRAAMERDWANLGGGDTPVSQTAMLERQQARMVDGVSLEGTSASAMAAAAAARSRGGIPPPAMVDDDVFVDTTTTGPVPAALPNPMSLSHPPTGGPVQHPTSALRETAQPQHYRSPPLGYPPHQHLQQLYQNQSRSPPGQGSPHWETAERIVQESLDNGEGRLGANGNNSAPVLGSPRGENGRLGRFYFEERK